AGRHPVWWPISTRRPRRFNPRPAVKPAATNASGQRGGAAAMRQPTAGGEAGRHAARSVLPNATETFQPTAGGEAGRHAPQAGHLRLQFGGFNPRPAVKPAATLKGRIEWLQDVVFQPTAGGEAGRHAGDLDTAVGANPFQPT